MTTGAEQNQVWEWNAMEWSGDRRVILEPSIGMGFEMEWGQQSKIKAKYGDGDGVWNGVETAGRD